MTKPISNTEWTREKILSMEPGRELDALVAEKVMGWRLQGQSYWLCGDDVVHDVLFWNPSTDMYAAWEVVEKMQCAHVHININWMDDQYCAEIIEMDPEEGYKYLGQCYDVKSAPEAISKCALLAVMDI